MQHPPCSPALRRPPHDPLRSEEQARRELGRVCVHPAELRRTNVQVFIADVGEEYRKATSDEERIKLMLIIADAFRTMIEPRRAGDRLIAYMDTRSGDDCRSSIHDQLSDMIDDLDWYLKELAEERAGDE